ncbi:MAG: helix-turn-helix transcriptional regulator [Candidatus Margulisbacteria bacterium]|jgi:transcriptional regulator with XRE-family HTH domain|nr:helix-turn-helix transcriptional regulator [Candidatus Margulisiibacteriota bacterium]
MDEKITSENLKKLLSSKLELLRKNSAQTIEAAADSLDIDLSEYYRILKGRRLPQLPTLLRINQKYGISMDWWFSELDDMEDKPQGTGKITGIRQKAIELELLSTFHKLDVNLQKTVLETLKTFTKQINQVN